MNYQSTKPLYIAQHQHPKRQKAFHLIRQFLSQQNYLETLAALDSEAKGFNDDHYRFDAEDDVTELTTKNLLTILDENEEKEMTDELRKKMKLNQEMEIFKNERIRKTSFKSISTMEGVHSSNILCVRVSHGQYEDFALEPVCQDGDDLQTTYLLSTAADRTLKVTDIATGLVLDTIYPHSGPILDIDVHPIYSFLITTSSMDGSWSIIDLRTRKCIQTVKDHNKYVNKARFSPNGDYIVTTSHDKTARFYHLDNSKSPMSPSYSFLFSKTFKGTVEAMAFLPNNTECILASHDDHFLYYVNLQSGETTVYNVNENGDDWVSFAIMELTVSPNGKYVLCSTDQANGRMMLLLANSHIHVKTYYGLQLDQWSQPKHCWHSSGRLFFATSDNGSIWVIEASNGKVLHKLSGHEGVVRSIAFDPKEHVLVSGSFDKTIKVWKCQIDIEEEVLDV